MGHLDLLSGTSIIIDSSKKTEIGVESMRHTYRYDDRGESPPLYQCDALLSSTIHRGNEFNAHFVPLLIP